MKTSKASDSELRAQIIEILTEEKEKYNLYTQLCRHYGVDPDPIATASWQAKNQALSQLLGGKTR